MSETGTKKKVFDFSLLRRIFQFAKPYQNRFYGSLVLSVLLAIMAPLRPMLIQLTINDGIKNETAAHFIKGPGGFIIEITIIQIALLLLESLCRFYFTFLTASLGQSVVKDLRITTYNKILHLNLRQFDKTPIGTLTTRTINDIESINDIFSDGLIPIIADLLSIISILVYMFTTNWKITLICLAPFPILIIATYFFKESVNKSFIRVRNAVASLNAFVQEHITGMSVVQAFASEKREFEKFNAINKEHRNANIKAIFAYSVFFPVVELVMALSTGLLVWWAAKDAAGITDDALRNEIAGIITSFIICLNLLFRPLRVIADKFNVLQMGMIASERVFKVLDNDDSAEDKGTLASKNVRGDVAFEDVSFAYIDEQYVLKNISFNIKAGETLAIVGHTGSGKTSIISLLNRLYHIQKGTISIDGINIEEYKLDELRTHIGVVLQDVFLFSDSIENNIRFGNEQAGIDRVKKAARDAGILKEIEQLPDGFQTIVGERGVTLSGGQKQRISIARALAKDASILILDDCLSAVDSKTENEIVGHLQEVLEGKTALIITHRVFSSFEFDRIFVLDQGRVAESGTRDELLQLNGLFADLYRRQQQQESPN